MVQSQMYMELPEMFAAHIYVLLLVLDMMQQNVIGCSSFHTMHGQ